MNSKNLKSKSLSILGLLLALPTAYFIFASILKFELHMNGPYDSTAPLLERMGIRETLGWNINLLILFGPVLAFLLTIFQFLKIKWNLENEELHFHITVQKHWFPLLVAAFSAGILAILFVYMVGENCNC